MQHWAFTELSALAEKFSRLASALYECKSTIYIDTIDSVISAGFSFSKTNVQTFRDKIEFKITSSVESQVWKVTLQASSSCLIRFLPLSLSLSVR